MNSSYGTFKDDTRILAHNLNKVMQSIEGIAVLLKGKPDDRLISIDDATRLLAMQRECLDASNSFVANLHCRMADTCEALADLCGKETNKPAP